PPPRRYSGRRSACVCTDESTTAPNPSLSLHDALPISQQQLHVHAAAEDGRAQHPEQAPEEDDGGDCRQQSDRYEIAFVSDHCPRSEEHTSELQSRENLVCRLLLEKKKTLGDARGGEVR